MKKIAVTNRHLCYAHFLKNGLARAGADPCDCLLELLELLARTTDYDTVLLREKDMTESDYAKLSASVDRICQRYGKNLILHNFPAVAGAYGCRVHLPFSKFSSMQGLTASKQAFPTGTSVHSVEDALFAEAHGAAYIIAGHIFATDCKKGLPARGLDWLASVCQSVSIPVYAIGGITDENAASVLSCGASGFCMMSHILSFAGQINETP